MDLQKRGLSLRLLNKLINFRWWVLGYNRNASTEKTSKHYWKYLPHQMKLSEGYYWFRSSDEDWEVCRIISIRDVLCAFFFFGRNTPIPITDLTGEWVRIEPPGMQQVNVEADE
jgi:hypothetical protein